MEPNKTTIIELYIVIVSTFLNIYRIFRRYQQTIEFFLFKIAC